MTVRAPLAEVVFVHHRAPGDQAQYLDLAFPPTWAATLAARIPADGPFRPSLHDLTLDDPASLRPSGLYLMSGWNQDLPALEEARRMLVARRPGARTLLGGPVAWSLEKAGELEALAGFDHVFVGEGEEEILGILQALRRGDRLPWLLRAPRPADLAASPPMRPDFAARCARRYAMGGVELSRGCPYLCEFCDITAQEGGNRTRSRKLDAILADVRLHCRSGCRQILLICDNLLGDPQAPALLDRLAALQDELGSRRAAFFTWCSLNVVKQPELLAKMRRAGIEVLFIGVESFGRASLEETRKLQNARLPIEAALRQVQGHGFLVVPGLIFGFDADRVHPAPRGSEAEAFSMMARGLRESGLLAGDPSFLVALPGTPLHDRLAASGRLRRSRAIHNVRSIESNVRFLAPRDALVGGFLAFTREDLSGRARLARLESHLALARGSGYVPPRPGRSLGSVALALLSRPASRRQAARRLLALAARPEALLHAARGASLALFRSGVPGRGAIFAFWLYAWTTALVKYGRLTERDLDVEGLLPSPVPARPPQARDDELAPIAPR